MISDNRKGDFLCAGMLISNYRTGDVICSGILNKFSSKTVTHLGHLRHHIENNRRSLRVDLEK